MSLNVTLGRNLLLKMQIPTLMHPYHTNCIFENRITQRIRVYPIRLGKGLDPTVYSLFSLLSRFKAYKLRLALLMLSLP